MNVADKCHQLSLILNSISRKIAFKDLQSSVLYLAQCTANIHTVRILFSMRNSFDVKHLGN
jgi:hypothetical protein